MVGSCRPLADKQSVSLGRTEAGWMARTDGGVKQANTKAGIREMDGLVCFCKVEAQESVNGSWRGRRRNEGEGEGRG